MKVTKDREVEMQMTRDIIDVIAAVVAVVEVQCIVVVDVVVIVEVVVHPLVVKVLQGVEVPSIVAEEALLMVEVDLLILLPPLIEVHQDEVLQLTVIDKDVIAEVDLHQAPFSNRVMVEIEVILVVAERLKINIWDWAVHQMYMIAIEETRVKHIIEENHIKL